MSDIVERAISPFNPATNTVQNRDKYNLFAPMASTQRIGMAGFNPAHFKVDEQIVSLNDEFSDLDNRMDTAEEDIDNLENRMTTAEEDIDSLENRMTTAEEDIDNLENRMNTAEEDIDNLDNRMTTAEEDIDDLDISKLDEVTTGGFAAYTHVGSKQIQTPVSQNAYSSAIVQRTSGGQITVPATPFNNTDVTSKQYVDGVIATEATTRGNADLALSQRIDAQEGLGGALTAHDFGTATPYIAEEIDLLTPYALSQIPSISTPSQIWNATWVTNLYDNNVWQLVNTPNTPEHIFEWVNIGPTVAGKATNEILGLSKGGTIIPINSDGEYYTTPALIGAATAAELTAAENRITELEADIATIEGANLDIMRALSLEAEALVLPNGKAMLDPQGLLIKFPSKLDLIFDRLMLLPQI